MSTISLNLLSHYMCRLLHCTPFKTVWRKFVIKIIFHSYLYKKLVHLQFNRLILLAANNCILGCMSTLLGCLTRSLWEPGGPCTKSMEVSESRMERINR